MEYHVKLNVYISRQTMWNTIFIYDFYGFISYLLFLANEASKY